MKKLLLDDEKTILRALFLGLKRAGHQATETNHPTEMLRKIRQENFDLQTEQVLSKDKPITEILQDIEHYMESHVTHLKRR